METVDTFWISAVVAVILKVMPEIYAARGRFRTSKHRRNCLQCAHYIGTGLRDLYAIVRSVRIVRLNKNAHTDSLMNSRMRTHLPAASSGNDDIAFNMNMYFVNFHN